MARTLRIIYRLLAFGMLVALFLLLISCLLGWRFEAILSDNMNPALKNGSLAVVSPVDSNAIQIGDIILYHSPTDSNSLIVNRVSLIEQSSPPNFQTKGDANPSPDAYLVSSNNVVGRVRFDFPWVGHFLRFTQNTPGVILLLIFPGIIILAYELVKLRKRIVENRPKPAVVSRQYCYPYPRLKMH